MKLVAMVLSVLWFGLSSLPAGAADLQKIDRSLVKEPKYKGEPYYALLVFGPKAEKRSWLVVDGETLFVDRNGNGDLTEASERVPLDEKEKQVTWLSLPEMYRRNPFDVGEVAGLRLRLDFLVRDRNLLPKTERDKQRLKVHTALAGEGGEIAILYRHNSPAPIHVTFCRQPKDAHICHIGGPLTFALRRGKDATLERGSDKNWLEVTIGTPGLPVRGAAGPVMAPLGITEVPANVHPVALIEFPHRDARQPPIKLQVVLDQRC